MKRIGLLLGVDPKSSSPFIGLYRHDERVLAQSTRRPSFSTYAAKVLLTQIDGAPAHEGEGLPKPTGP